MAPTTTAVVPKARKTLVIRPPPFRLFDLPQEIRDLTYGYVLVEPPVWERQHESGCPTINTDAAWERPVFRSSRTDTEEEAADRNRPFWHQLQSPLERVTNRYPLTPGQVEACRRSCLMRRDLSLRLVNRQIYQETEDVFWRHNIFCYRSWETWVHELGDCGKPFSMWKQQKRELCGPHCPPPSVRKKVQRLSLMKLRKEWIARPSFEEMGYVVSAVKRLRRLVHVELPLHVVHLHLEMLAAYRIARRLETVTAGVLETVVMGQGTTRLEMHFKHVLRMPECFQEGHSGWKRLNRLCGRHGGKNCIPCWMELFQMGADLKTWSEPHPLFSDGTEVVTRSLAEVRSGFDQSMSIPAQRIDGQPYVLKLQLEGDKTEVVRVYGLPCVSPRARKELVDAQMQRQLREARALIALARDERVEALKAYDEVEYPQTPQLRKPISVDAHKHAYEQRAEARKEKREEEKRHESHREKSAAKKQQKERTKAMQNLSLERKAAHYREGK